MDNYVKYLVNRNNISTYIEPFAGGAAVALRLLVNNDVKKIIINDYDRGIYALWNTIVNQPERLIKLIFY
ncbi:DNA adenine methylase [Heyndrickxia sp. NPDC080065]|uniref:DNA adenine methylase n=1 Tax=Heyndrickxia sp. NPDC080065 TaxID=3390568 RepID=UPI003D08AFE3